MRVLVACECSGVVREAFRALGHDAWSCDLKPADDGSEFHHTGDCLSVLSLEWDLMIAFPPCDYLTNSAAWAYKDANFERYPGVGYHQKVKPGTLVGEARRAARVEAVAFFRALWNAPIPRICIENPVGHMSSLRKPSQIIQPHQFGDDASKGTCLWLRELPLLVPTESFPPRIVEYPPGSGKWVKRWSNQTDSGQSNVTPSDDRAAKRAVTYSGIAGAMAAQWGHLLCAR